MESCTKTSVQCDLSQCIDRKIDTVLKDVQRDLDAAKTELEHQQALSEKQKTHVQVRRFFDYQALLSYEAQLKQENHPTPSNTALG